MRFNPLALVPTLLALTAVACPNPMGLQQETAQITPDLDESEQVRLDLAALSAPQGVPRGRAPGSLGHTAAAEHIRSQFQALGLEPAFTNDQGETTFDQPLQVLHEPSLIRAQLTYTPIEGEPLVFGEQDITPHWSSGSATVRAPGLFTGYAVVSGPNGYMSFTSRNDLAGMIALAFRMEPMTDEGTSLWTGDGQWSPRASSIQKAVALTRRQTEGVILLTPPDATDIDATEPAPPKNAAELTFDVPVITLSLEASEQLIAAADSQGRSLREVRQEADAGPVLTEYTGEIELILELDQTPSAVANIGAILPGKGALSDELIVLIAHYDGPADLPAADDNASGVAGLLHCARTLKSAYARQLSDVDSARSILFLATASGFDQPKGTERYIEEPVRAMEQHALAIALDSIGRSQRDQLTVTGLASGRGLEAWLSDVLDSGYFEITRSQSRWRNVGDHTPFVAAGSPALMFTTGGHSDQYTEFDTIDKIDPQSVADIAEFVADVTLELAFTAEQFEVVDPRRGRNTPQGPRRVRLGVQPVFVEGEAQGIEIRSVFDNTPAATAGLLAGDLLTKWNDTPLDSLESFILMISTAKPGDSANITFTREGQEQTTTVNFPGGNE